MNCPAWKRGAGRSFSNDRGGKRRRFPLASLHRARTGIASYRSAHLSGGLGDGHRGSAFRDFDLWEPAGYPGLCEAPGEVDDPVLPVWRRVAPRYLGHEAGGSLGVPRALPPHRHLRPGYPTVRAPPDDRETGAPPGHREFSRRCRAGNGRSSRRLLLQPDRSRSRPDVPDPGQRSQTLSR